MQRTKFIDLTRTYLPVDPNAFPTTMHGTGQEDSPENRIPAMAYDGYNFLPTGHGYKSYFGTNSEIQIDALTARADFVFMYQNTAYENILIALTESGIWTKRASTTGAWTQSVVMPLPVIPVEHYDWTFVVIAQVLYCYRQNYASYQKIVSDVTNGITISSIVPNTLNMSAQMGIFRAGGRLGFWDSDDSVSWSNQDDYADFAPSIQTLAGSQKFIDVNGRITIIRGHGPGFIMYCSKSIIFVYPDQSSQMQWKPQVIFGNNGIPYARMCVEGSPDTTHFVYTDAGLYQINNAKEELIVPEIVDTLAKHNGPIYLSMMEGRYLYLEILDADFMEGWVQFSEGTAEAITYTFPGSSVTLAQAIADETLQGTNYCSTIGAMGNGNFATKPIVGDQKPGTDWKPQWTAYFSNSGIKDASNVTWTNIPVATIDPNGVEANQCPAGNANKTTQLSTTSANKTAVTGAAAYIDGIWTMERFVQTQTAIWKIEQEAIDAWFNTVEARQKYVVKVTNVATDPTTPMATDKSLIGRYVGRFSEPYFTFSPCEFRLTRLLVSAKDLYRIKKNIINGVNKTVVPTSLGFSLAPAGNNPGFAWGGIYSTPIAALQGTYPLGSLVNYPYSGATSINQYTNTAFQQIAVARGDGNGSGGGPFGVIIYEIFQLPTGFSYENPDWTGNASTYSIFIYPSAGRWEKTEIMIATNQAEEVDIAPIEDNGYCTLASWNYTKTNNTTGNVAAAACVSAQETPDSDLASQVSSMDGSFCSKPFEPVTIPGAPSLATGWPSQSITLPASTFLLQNGSIAPVYPTFQGALVYDLHLKRWGKYKGLYKGLLNYQPINNAVNGGVPFASFGILGGILAIGGKLKLFDAYPDDAFITYGKIGYYRQGITSVEEVRVSFASPSTGYVKTESSISGRFIDPLLTRTELFTDASSVRLTGGYPGSWCNIKIGGIFDINYLEFRGFTNGER